MCKPTVIFMEIYSAEAVNGTDLCGFNEDPKDHLQTSERALVTDWYLELHHYPVENVTGGKSVFVIKVWFKTERLFSSRQVSLFQRPSGHLHSFTVILCYWTAVHVSRKKKRRKNRKYRTVHSVRDKNQVKSLVPSPSLKWTLSPWISMSSGPDLLLSQWS